MCPHSIAYWRTTLAHAPSSSIPRSVRRDQPSINRALRRFLTRELPRLHEDLSASLDDFYPDRYRKHFSAWAHTCLLLFHGLSGAESLTQSFAAFPDCKVLASASGLGGSDHSGVSFSQFADSNTTRPSAFLAALVSRLLNRVGSLGLDRKAGLPADLHIQDSTFLPVSAVLASWLPSNSKFDKPGVKIQVQYAPALDIPEHFLITNTRVSDQEGLDRTLLENPGRLSELRGHTLVIDLGYYSHRRFGHLLAAGVHFVSRLHPQAKVNILGDFPFQQPLPSIGAGRITILSDQRVDLGPRTNRLPNLRLITARVEPSAKAARKGARPLTYCLITDRLDLDAIQVVQFYLWRWQIELFFRWIKRYVHLARLLGYSPNAVQLTLYLALLVHLLALLAAQASGLDARSPALLFLLRWALANLDPDQLSSPDPPPHQLTLPIPLTPPSPT